MEQEFFKKSAMVPFRDCNQKIDVKVCLKGGDQASPALLGKTARLKGSL